MKNKNLGFFISFFAVMVLIGAGCTTIQGIKQPELPDIFDAPEMDTEVEEETEEEVVTADTPCPEETVRFWSPDNYFSGVTFCYEPHNDLENITVRREGNTIVLHPESNPTFTHSIVPVNSRSMIAMQDYLKLTYMTEENQEACEVIMTEGKNYDQYTITTPDLGDQLKCGSARDGSFYLFHDTNTVNAMFYIRIGQDTFLPSSTWLETFEPISLSEKPEQPSDLYFLKESEFVTETLGIEYNKNTFESSEMGIKFDYPSNWGPVAIRREPGFISKGQECPRQISLNFLGIDRSATAIVVGNTDESCGAVGRGGYWGDESHVLDTSDAVEAWCVNHDICNRYQNKNGVLLAHGHWEVGNYPFEVVVENVDEYTIRHEGHTFDTILISNSQFKIDDKAILGDELKDLVNSIELID